MTTPIYTDQMLLDAFRAAYMNIALRGSKSYTILNRTFFAFDLAEIQKTIAWLESRVDAASQPGFAGGTILVGTNQFTGANNGFGNSGNNGGW